MEPLYRYYLDALGASREAFAARHAGLFALRPPVPDLEAARSTDEDEDAEATDVAPVWGETDARALARDRDAAREWEVALIRKRPDYPPFNRVVVGRSPASDLVVRVGGVSRLHGHFHVAGPAVTHVEDRGSRNGTTRNGVALAPFAPVPVAPGDVLHFGESSCDYSTPPRSTPSFGRTRPSVDRNAGLRVGGVFAFYPCEIALPARLAARALWRPGLLTRASHRIGATARP